MVLAVAHPWASASSYLSSGPSPILAATFMDSTRCVCMPGDEVWLCGGASPTRTAASEGGHAFFSPSHPRVMAESTEPHAASPWRKAPTSIEKTSSAPAF